MTIKYYVLSAGGNDNDENNSDDMIFDIKDTELYVFVVTLSTKDNQELSKYQLIKMNVKKKSK